MSSRGSRRSDATPVPASIAAKVPRRSRPVSAPVGNPETAMRTTSRASKREAKQGPFGAHIHFLFPLRCLLVSSAGRLAGRTTSGPIGGDTRALGNLIPARTWGPNAPNRGCLTATSLVLSSSPSLPWRPWSQLVCEGANAAPGKALCAPAYAGSSGLEHEVPSSRWAPAATRHTPATRSGPAPGVANGGQVQRASISDAASMYFDYLIVLVFAAVGIVFVFANLGGGVDPAAQVARHAQGLETYECGEETIGDAWIQFDIRYYTVALVYVIFAVEIAFLFPWALVLKDSVAGDGRGGRERASARSRWSRGCSSSLSSSWVSRTCGPRETSTGCWPTARRLVPTCPSSAAVRALGSRSWTSRQRPKPPSTTPRSTKRSRT